MISFKEFLIELFDKPVPYIRDDDPYGSLYIFKVKDHTYELSFSNSKEEVIHIVFSIKYDIRSRKNHDKSEFDLTNIGDQFPILATIKKISEDHFTRYHLRSDQIIKFDTFNPKSAKLYTKYAKWLANYVRGELEISKYKTGKGTIFEIVKK